jgi:hypothetical protein
MGASRRLRHTMLPSLPIGHVIAVMFVQVNALRRGTSSGSIRADLSSFV